MIRRIAQPVARSAELAVGRRNLARLARFLGDHARLDVPNGMETNGELMVQAVAARHARTRPLVAVDAGANRGEWTRQLLDQCRATGVEVAVHAFEPSPFTFDLLSAGVRDPDRASVTLVNEGLSDKVGEATLHQFGPGIGSNSLHGAAGSTTGLTPETVVVTTLDAYCARAGVTYIDLLKIDTEGHDCRVLEGAREVLQNQIIDVVQFEYNHRWIGARRYLKDAFELMEPKGYRIGKVTPRGIELYARWHPELESFREANFLAVRRGLEHRFTTFAWWNEGHDSRESCGGAE